MSTQTSRTTNAPQRISKSATSQNGPSKPTSPSPATSKHERSGTDLSQDREDEELVSQQMGEEEDYEDGIQSLKSRLSQIKLKMPSPKLEAFDPANFPPSYKDNEPKELKAIQYCKNFLKQYNHLCTARCALFLKPLNEFGVKKVVCTTIVPTQLPYADLLDWPGIAEFLAGYLSYDRLSPAYELPKTLLAPQTILERLHGHCFEYSTVLCSMLIGAGYDAYVVSGYATREVCNCDLSYNICPFVEQDQVVYTATITKTITRYSSRSNRTFTSEYELRMATKAEAARRVEEQAKKDAANRAKQLQEAPPPDPLEGRRVHSWVLVLKGHRDVDKTFFIEPTTGITHPTDWDQYLHIESIWNHLNYYVNMDFDEGVADLSYNIGDSRHWEYLFPGQDLHVRLTVEERAERWTQVAMQGDQYTDETFFDVPVSWCIPLKITRDDFDRKYPTGKRVRRYKYVVVEDFCRYLNPDGMVRKIYVYKDLLCEGLNYTLRYYSDRSDHLQSRFLHHETGKVVEKFDIGRDDFLREHHYLASFPGPESKRIMIFEEGKRTDELYKREEDEMTLWNYYKNRSDRKIYKEVKFGPEGKVLESPKILLPDPRPIEYIIEKFTRNPDVPANDDIAKVTFSLWTDEIEIEYHVDDDRIVGSSRHFLKPPLWWDETIVLAWSPELHSCFEADLLVEAKSEFELYTMLINLMKMESKTRDLTRTSEKEVRHILKMRGKEEEKLQLVKTYVQADRDEALRAVRLQLKAQAKANRLLAKSDIIRDYLEPFMHRVGLDEITNKKQAIRIKDDCLRDLKEALICQANMIKEHFEKETQIIESTQKWYQENFTALTLADLNDYRSFLIQHMFTAHILEQRLINLKEYAPIKYQELYDTMLKDKRLEQFLI